LTLSASTNVKLILGHYNALLTSFEFVISHRKSINITIINSLITQAPALVFLSHVECWTRFASNLAEAMPSVQQFIDKLA
jgi:hypothetical protein